MLNVGNVYPLTKGQTCPIKLIFIKN